jgi:hypothetical protein
LPQVRYDHELPYAYDEVTGERFPRLTFCLSAPDDPSRAVDVDAFLDSGAQCSLFDGRLAKAIGVDPLSGPEKTFASATGGSISATLHRVRIEHTLLGAFDLDVGFSSSHIRRNLLGRDFFNLVQLGFRERHLTLFVTATP